MNTDSLLVYIKTEIEIFKEIAEDVETKFEASNYDLNWPLPKGKNKKDIGVMKDELDRKIIKRIVGLRAKTYSYIINDGGEDKKPKGTRIFIKKNQLNLKIIKNVTKQLNLKIN